VEKC